MTARVFGSPGDIIVGEALTLDEDESRYLVRVRRKAVGDPVEVLDGRGGLWSATRIEDEHPRRARVNVEGPIEPPTPVRRVVLLQAVIDASPTASIIAAATALGVEELVWVTTARSQGRPTSPDRVERLLRAAMRQCGRPAPPQVHGPIALQQALDDRPDWTRSFAWEGQKQPADPPSGADAPGHVLLVGPEGGFASDEADLIRARGFIPFSLGPWTLRSETAAVAALTRVLWPGHAG